MNSSSMKETISSQQGQMDSSECGIPKQENKKNSLPSLAQIIKQAMTLKYTIFSTQKIKKTISSVIAAIVSPSSIKKHSKSHPLFTTIKTKISSPPHSPLKKNSSTVSQQKDISTVTKKKIKNSNLSSTSHNKKYQLSNIIPHVTYKSHSQPQEISSFLKLLDMYTFITPTKQKGDLTC